MVDIVPVAVLRLVRDRGPISDEALKRLFGVMVGITGGKNRRAASRLRQCLSAIEAVGLIERVPLDEGEDGCLERKWRATALVERLQEALELGLGELEKMGRRSHLAEVTRLANLYARLKVSFPNTHYRTDLLASLDELARCIDERCYIAVMGLSGKILEICIKHRMQFAGLFVEDTWMLGTLLTKINESGDQYVDPSLRNVSNIIKESRIPAVHAKRDVPIPSEDQAAMVVRAVCDVIERMLLSPK